MEIIEHAIAVDPDEKLTCNQRFTFQPKSSEYFPSFASS